MPKVLSQAEIAKCVNYYLANRATVATMLNQLNTAIVGSKPLMSFVHSTKARLKDPVHLKAKLLRKCADARKSDARFWFEVKHLLTRVTDLAGIRILHLHTTQVADIDRELRAVFAEYRYRLSEKPKARTWDDESREFFKGIGIQPVDSPKLYTSVHYVVESFSETKCTCEIQVRTLAEELWGEVNHTVNYPKESMSDSCREQIKVLARVTSSCSRLVDSIFRASRNADL